MVEIGEGIDHRHRGVARQFVHDLLPVGAHHDAVHIAGHDPGHVLERFVAGQLGVAAGKVDDLPAQTVHGRFKGNTGPGGRLFKDEGNGLADQLLMTDAGLALFFQEQGLIEVSGELRLAEILQCQEVLCHESTLSVPISRNPILPTIPSAG